MMKSKYLAISVLVAVLFAFSAIAAFAVPDERAEAAKREGLEKTVFIHYKDSNAKEPNSHARVQANTCYKLMGVKWKSFPVNYIINPANPQGLTTQFITSTMMASAETWDDATSKELFNNTYAVNTSAQYGVQDFNNVLAFGDYPNSGVIAVTTVWYTRVSKQIVEFDMLFNTDFSWGDATLNSTKMDLENIAVHELGHAAGLADIYSSSCSDVTMYGYSWYGDTSKRTLEQPDIAGLQRMYGA